MAFLDDSDTPHARVVFAMCVFIVMFYLLVPASERSLLAAPFKSEGHYEAILSMALLIIIFPVLAGLAGWNLNPQKKTHLEKVVTVEGFVDDDGDATSMPDVSQPSTSFCAQHSSEPEALETACNDFDTRDSCLTVNCCGWLAHKVSPPHPVKPYIKTSCVAANELSRPVFKSDANGRRLEMLSFQTRMSNAAKAAEANAHADERAAVGDVKRGLSDAKQEVKRLWGDI